MRKKTTKRVYSETNQLQNNLTAKTENQKKYIRAIVENDIIFCIGPSGSGKSFVAAGIACEYLHKKKIDQIIISRPLICTGKDIGSLPGELKEKINPYLSPMQNNLKHFLGNRYYGLYINENKILFETLELMRGATFNNAIMILDEAQNCTLEQIKMFVTRIGENSKVIINGDINQTDLKNKSGLDLCINKVCDVEGVEVTEMSNIDIQRHSIIAKFLQAIET
jgi:phosphate starvation-inducible PhoH-like protein